MARVLIVCLGTGKQRVVREPDVLRHEFTGELVDVPQYFGVLVGEFPVARHHVDAETIAGLHHVTAAGPVRGAGPLPGVAAVEQQAVLRPRLVAQSFHQRLQMGESPDLAVTPGGLCKVEMGDGMRKTAARRHAHMLQ